MSTMQVVPNDSPEWKEWNGYKISDEYQNTLKWANREGFTEGSLWAVFDEGWRRAMSTPTNTVEAPQIQHILSRDQRDALVAANVLLAVMQDERPEMFNRIQGILDEFSDMLYG